MVFALAEESIMFRRNAILALIAAVLIAAQIPAITAQQAVKAPNPATDWPMFSHDLAGTRFSPLKQITASNSKIDNHLS